MQTIAIAEDFASLATATVTLQRAAKRLERRLQQKRRLRRCETPRKRFNIDCLYASKSNDALRAFFKHKCPGTKIVEDSEMGRSDRGYNLFGVEGPTAQRCGTSSVACGSGCRTAEGTGLPLYMRLGFRTYVE